MTIYRKNEVIQSYLRIWGRYTHQHQHQPLCKILQMSMLNKFDSLKAKIGPLWGGGGSSLFTQQNNVDEAGCKLIFSSHVLFHRFCVVSKYPKKEEYLKNIWNLQNNCERKKILYVQDWCLPSCGSEKTWQKFRHRNKIFSKQRPNSVITCVQSQKHKIMKTRSC